MSVINNLVNFLTPSSITPVNLNNSFQNIINYLNAPIGVSDGSDANPGVIGEYIRSYAGSVNVAASGVFGNVTSISLTAGDWDVSGALNIVGGNSFVTSPYELYIYLSLYSGSARTDASEGDNDYGSYIGNSNTEYGLSCPAWRVSITSTTTVYLKANIYSYSGGTPTVNGRISARRMR